MDYIGFAGFHDPVSSFSHFLAAFGFLFGSVQLIGRGRGNTARVIALSVFTFSLVFLFSMSGVYHLLERGGAARSVLQRLDHSAIWTLIAGTFTPIHVILFRGPWRWAMLTLVWVVAITGLVLEVVFFTSFPEWLVASLFLGLGWMGTFTMMRFRKLFGDRSLWLMVGGGVSYSIGAVMDLTGWPVLISGVLGPHDVFHFLVIAGALQHWFFIYRWSDHPVANTIVMQVQIFPGERFVAKAISERMVVQASSMLELKESIKERVRARYHESIEPAIHLKYSNEEILS